jgi:hypothetical protein
VPAKLCGLAKRQSQETHDTVAIAKAQDLESDDGSIEEY